MTISRRLICSCVLSLLTFAGSHLQAQTSAGTESSCREFVQKFYDWYLPKARTAKERASDIVLKTRSSVLSRELQRQLKADSDAQAKSDDLVGLDFDPFLNTQDPDFESCTVGKTVLKGSGYWADVTCVFPGANASKSHVTAELISHQGQWIFVNFHYQDGSKKYDLLSILKGLREERQPKSKQPK